MSNQITYEQRKAVYQDAIDAFGAEYQVIVAIEELSELTKVLCKMFRENYDPEALIDELADVTIMTEQLRLIADVNEQVCERMDFKVARLAKRVAQFNEVELHED